MDKLNKLLEEYPNWKWDLDSLKFLRGFIKWLVDKDKIDTRAQVIKDVETWWSEIKDVIWYDDRWYYVLWEKDCENKTKYRLIKVWKLYVIQKWFTFTHNEKWRITNYSNVTEPVSYDVAIAKIKLLKWSYEIKEEFEV